MHSQLPEMPHAFQGPKAAQRVFGWLRERMATIKWVAALCVALALLPMAWLLRGIFDKHEGTAAWVQAVGSLAIIAFTAWSANRQFRESRERDRQERRYFLIGVTSLARNCMKAFDEFLLRLPPPGVAVTQPQFSEAYAPAEFDIAIDGLAAVPLHLLGDARLITAVLMVRGAMSRIKRDLENADRHRSFPRRLHEIRNHRTPLFNALANVVRIVEGYTAEEELGNIARRL